MQSHATDVFECAEVDSGSYFAGEFFTRIFGDPVPDWGHHLIFFYRRSATHFVPLTYLNFAPHEEVMLVGGGVTNGRAFQFVEEEHSNQFREMGGGLLQLLRFGFTRFADDCEAFFGHAGDERALEVDLQAGFVLTRHEHLIVNFHRPLPVERQEELIEKIHAIGPF